MQVGRRKPISKLGGVLPVSGQGSYSSRFTPVRVPEVSGNFYRVGVLTKYWITVAHDLKGQTFGRLTVCDMAESKHGQRRWLCACVCGNSKIVYGSPLLRGKSKSCGCLQKELAKAKRLTHGLSNTPVYKVWSAMLQRCNNSAHKQYADYGGRGISVCSRWQDFANFLADMGEPPEGTSLERVRNAEGYNPENCVWATPVQQARNRRSTKLVTFKGKEAPLIQHCETEELPYGTVLARLSRGWTIEESLTRRVRGE